MFANLFRYIFFHPSNRPPHPIADLNINPHRLPLRWIYGGVALVGIMLALSRLSVRFDYSIPLFEQPVVWLVVLLMVAGLAFFYLAELIQHSVSGWRVMAWILLAGLIMRLAMFFSTPILEVDFYRYFWDGAVTAHGMNPYRHAPQEVMDALQGEGTVPAPLIALAQHPRAQLERINHPQIRTIYPPVTQAAFALAYWIDPFGMTSWRLVLLLADLATLVLLLMILRRQGQQPLWVAIYWLNPLLVKEMFNSGHMDLLIFPLLLAALLFSERRQLLPSVLMLVLAAGVKIWPAALLLIVLRPFWPRYGRILGGMAIFGVLLALLAVPLLLAGIDDSAGIAAYSNRWQLNDSLFRILVWSAEWSLPLLDIPAWRSQEVARYAAALLIGAATLYFSFRKPADPSLVYRNSLMVIAAIFLLSPTQFPWYSLWLLPLLVVVPRRSFLMLTVLLPLYYLWHLADARGMATQFNQFVVWIEFVPVWLVLLLEWHRDRRLQVHSLREALIKYER